MKTKHWLYLSPTLLIMTLFLVLSGCKKDSNITYPVPSTSAATNVTSTAAWVEGKVDNTGVVMIAHGICWSTSPQPTVALTTKTYHEWSDNEWNCTCSDLMPGTTYYVRTYYITSAGTIYGGEVSFTTPNI